MEILDKLYELELKKKEIEKEIKNIQQEILDTSIEKTLENDHIKVTIIPASSYETIDMKQVKEKEPNLYKELEEVYSKTVNRKEYVKVKLK